jgi:hypothetical protein
MEKYRYYYMMYTMRFQKIQISVWSITFLNKKKFEQIRITTKL